MIITLKEYPEILAAIRKVSPKYRKHKAIISEANSYENHGSHWDGGSRSAPFLLRNGVVTPLPGPTAPPQFGGGGSVTTDINDGDYVIVLGTFRGKQATASVYLNKFEGENNDS